MGLHCPRPFSSNIKMSPLEFLFRQSPKI
jgi:hypothetical protein